MQLKRQQLAPRDLRSRIVAGNETTAGTQASVQSENNNNHPPERLTMTDSATRRRLARLSLTGLSIGDAFGQQLFSQPELLASRKLPCYPWTFTDDTVMGIATTQNLEVCGETNQQDLATRFATFYDEDPHRGYGSMAHEILRAISDGHAWQSVVTAAFNGTGSMGNGAAMRIGPLGAYYFDNPEQAAKQAKRNAEVTHAHCEGQAGAIAVAVAASLICNWKHTDELEARHPDLISLVVPFVPDSDTRNRIQLAEKVSGDATPQEAAARLGCGKRLLSQDTVPYCLWVAQNHGQNFPEAMWATASVFGDIDTNCAIVGSIISLAVGKDEIPEEWLLSREPLIG